MLPLGSLEKAWKPGVGRVGKPRREQWEAAIWSRMTLGRKMPMKSRAPSPSGIWHERL